jgi:hypothetical protein
MTRKFAQAAKILRLSGTKYRDRNVIILNTFRESRVPLCLRGVLMRESLLLTVFRSRQKFLDFAADEGLEDLPGCSKAS